MTTPMSQHVSKPHRPSRTVPVQKDSKDASMSISIGNSLDDLAPVLA